jgi:hypothetical protein
VTGPASALGRAGAALLLALASLPLHAVADGFSASLEPSVNAARTDTSGEGVDAARADSLLLQQRYRLNLDRSLFPQLRLGATASYQQENGTLKQDLLPTTHSEARRWSLGLRLDLGAGVWNAGGAYELRGDEAGSGGTASSPRRLNEVVNLFAGWRPADLPSLDLRYVRTHTWESRADGLDQTAQVATLQSTYNPVTSVELRYRGAYSWTGNEASGVEDRTLTQGLRSSWGETFLDRRASVFTTVEVTGSRRWTSATRADAFRETQQTLASGLSAVERFPALPERITLDPNPALADGDLAAGAGLDLGFGRSDAGDTDPRDLGGRFVDVATPVNELRVWVDRRLPPAISAAFTWAVYRSDDNQAWTPVALSGGARFSALETRFEIPIARTSARYLKVVTRPLASGVTTDPTYAQIAVTELQAFLVEPVGLGTETGSTGRVGASLSAKLVLQRSWNVAWDTFVDAARASDRDFTRWILTNGLSFTRRLAAPVMLSGRAERSDSDAGAGVETGHRASLSAGLEPLPTLGGTLSASASRLDGPAGGRTEVGTQAGVRADLYQGVSLSTQGDLSRGWADGDVRTRRFSGTGNVAVTPHRTVTLAGSFTYSDSLRTQPGAADLRDRAARMDATASWTPVPALGISGSLGRELYRQAGTLASLSVNASPFRDGALQLSFAYSESLDTTTDTRSRRWGPSLRWRVARRGYLDLAYTDARTRATAVTTDSQVLFAKLLLNLG